MAEVVSEEAVVGRLFYESSVFPFNNGYRRSFWHSCVVVVYLYLKSRRCIERTIVLPDAAALCFAWFKNEASAIEKAATRNHSWQKFQLSLKDLKGMDWKTVFQYAPRYLRPFLRQAIRQKGWRAIRDFAYPFVGYLVMRYFESIFPYLDSRTAIVTTNLVHPLSVGVHLAALRTGRPTIFWEHAMTPRLVARDFGYSEYFVYCDHTRENFLRAGVDAAAVKLVAADSKYIAAPIGRLTDIRVAVAVNDLDQLAATDRLVTTIRGLGFTCTLRVHDSDKRIAQLAKIASRHAAHLSNAATVPVADFLRETELVIAGNSNIVLDCLRAGVRVIYYWEGDETLFDYYGIVAAARVVWATNIDMFAKILSDAR